MPLGQTGPLGGVGAMRVRRLLGLTVVQVARVLPLLPTPLILLCTGLASTGFWAKLDDAALTIHDPSSLRHFLCAIGVKVLGTLFLF